MKPFNSIMNKPIYKEDEKKSELECIYGKHKAELLHRGTAYCRSCYDKRNLTAELIN